MTEVITYETLREIQRDEKRSSKLYSLGKNFYSVVQDYLGRELPEDDISRNEILNARKILEDIHDRREKKIINYALAIARNNEKLDVPEMTPEEHLLLEKLVETLKKYRGNIDNTSHSEAKEVPETEVVSAEEKEDLEDSETKLVQVKLLEELPQIVGADMEEYGPYSEGEVAEIPEENAKILIENKKAEEK
jgi:DNA replication initiation complex subunit (GINS family)